VCENATFSYPAVPVHGKDYGIQPEYSNEFHGCVFVP
jgi:hypothetical protein